MPRLLSSLLWLFGGLGLNALSAVLGYAVANESRHTGWEPYSLLFGFVPLILGGVSAVLARRRQPVLSTPGLVAIAIGILGLLVLIYLDQSNRLVQYNRWLQRGMP